LSILNLMCKLVLCIWVLNCFCVSNANGQIRSDFEGNYQKDDLLWTGDTASFTHIQGELRSNHSIINSTFYISTKANYDSIAQWEIDVRLTFNPSSANYVDFFILADSNLLLQVKNGFFVRIGNTQDEISLYRLLNGFETKVIDGVDGLLNSSNNSFRLLIEKHQDSFVLKRKRPSELYYFTEGFYLSNLLVPNNYIGLRIRQSTASFVNRHFFDNLYSGPYIADTIAPLIDSLTPLNENELTCVFNEVCDSISMTQLSNYQLISESRFPDSIFYQNNKTVKLHFKSVIKFNTFYQLKVDSIKDLSNNFLSNIVKDFIFIKPDKPSLFDLLITELMVDPDPPVALPNKEYVEITNVSGRFLDLSACTIADPTSSKTLPSKVLFPDSILVLENIPSLNNAGDDIFLTNANGQLIHHVSYIDKWYKDNAKSKGGYSLEMIDYNQPCLTEINWSASNDMTGGTPGLLNSVKANLPKDTMGIRIISFRIENDSIIHLLFNKSFDTFSLNQLKILVNQMPIGYKTYRLSITSAELSLVLYFKPDKAILYSIEFNGLRDCEGVVQKEIIHWQWTSKAKRNDIIINEVLFNPYTGNKDFIEFYNQTDFAFDLSEYFVADIDNNGQLNNYHKLSTSTVVLNPHQYLLLTEDTINICTTYQCINAEALKLKISKLVAMPDDQGKFVLVGQFDEVIDSLSYHKNWHSPLLRDQNGVSLERLDKLANSNNPLNWHSAASKVGFATPGYGNSQKLGQTKSEKYFYLESKTISPDGDGFEDFLTLHYQLPVGDYNLSINIYTAEGVFIKKVINNQSIGIEGFITWDGTDYNQQKAPIGIYVMEIVAFSIKTKEVLREKLSCVVAQRF
jgi:hypothetical protein